MKAEIPDKDYKKILDKMPISCVDVIIKNRNRVLLVYRNDAPAKDQWWFPGGRVLKKERLESAAKRKAVEETGLDVKVVKQIGTYETIFPDGKFPDLKDGVHSINICFLVELINEKQEVKIDSTSESYKWVDKIDENLSDYVKKVLVDSKVF